MIGGCTSLCSNQNDTSQSWEEMTYLCGLDGNQIKIFGLKIIVLLVIWTIREFNKKRKRKMSDMFEVGGWIQWVRGFSPTYSTCKKLFCLHEPNKTEIIIVLKYKHVKTANAHSNNSIFIKYRMGSSLSIENPFSATRIAEYKHRLEKRINLNTISKISSALCTQPLSDRRIDHC